MVAENQTRGRFNCLALRTTIKLTDQSLGSFRSYSSGFLGKKQVLCGHPNQILSLFKWIW